MAESHYSMSTGADDEHRLKLLNDAYNPFSRAFIQETPIANDATALEIGCGAGHQAIWMAQHIVPDGLVIAADVSDEQINIAKNNVKLSNIKNIEFCKIDIENFKGKSIAADLITNRFVLLHLKNPAKAVETMLTLLNPGGYLICQDAIMSGVIAGPASETLSQAMCLFSEHLRKQNKNPDIGAELYAICKSLSLQAIELKVAQPILYTAEQKSLLQLSFLAIKQSLLDLQLLDETEFNKINQGMIDELNNDQQIYLPGRLIQIRSRR